MKLRLGGLKQAKERVRGARHGVWLDVVARDVRYALRQVRRNPAFSAIAIAMLALGIGGMTAMFSAFDCVTVWPLPDTDADHLVMVWDWEIGANTTSLRGTTPHPRNGLSGAASMPSSWISRMHAAGRRKRSPATANQNWSPRGRSRGHSGASLACSPCLGVPLPRTRTTRACASSSSATGCGNARFGGASNIVGRAIPLSTTSPTKSLASCRVTSTSCPRARFTCGCLCRRRSCGRTLRGMTPNGWRGSSRASPWSTRSSPWQR